MNYIKDEAGRVIGPDHVDNVAFMEYQKAEAASAPEPRSLDGLLLKMTTPQRPAVEVSTGPKYKGVEKVLNTWREGYYKS